MRVVAILATRNERRFIVSALGHLIANGIDVYLLDNESTDDTVEIARPFLGRGLLQIETIVHPGYYDWVSILRRKEAITQEVDADWFMHVDADEIHLSPRAGETLRDALARVDAEGHTAVNFQEFTFVPTKEAPDHDHPHFRETMRHYYPFSPGFPRLIRAWKAVGVRPDLASSGGHLAGFAGRSLSPETFLMRHYLFLSVAHANEKYVRRKYAQEEVARGWHGWRATIRAEDFVLPPQADLRRSDSDLDLDASNPRTSHIVDFTV